MAVYKKRLLTAKSDQEEEEPSLKKRYEAKPKEELTVQSSGFIRLRKLYFNVMKTVMGIFAMIGAISLLRPELRTVLIGLLAEAVRELQGF